jgi:hypothetical protein
MNFMSSSKPVITVIDAFPPMSAGAPEPVIFAGDELHLAYRVLDDSHEYSAAGYEKAVQATGGQWCVIVFESYTQLKFGHPNMDVLSGHPLHKYGLRPYQFHEVAGSPWLAEVKKVNSVHPMDSPEHWADVHHLVIAFHDETLEILTSYIPTSTVVSAASGREALDSVVKTGGT